MANAKQCDRCGKFYSVDDLDDKHFTVVTRHKRVGGYINMFDVCPDCEAELRAWANGNKNPCAPVEETDEENEDDPSPFTSSWMLDMESKIKNFSHWSYGYIKHGTYLEGYGKLDNTDTCYYINCEPIAYAYMIYIDQEHYFARKPTDKAYVYVITEKGAPKKCLFIGNAKDATDKILTDFYKKWMLKVLDHLDPLIQTRNK